MAGYNNTGNTNNNNPGYFSKVLRQISKFGMDYDDMKIKNSRAVGQYEDPTDASVTNNMYDVFSRNAVQKILSKKSVSYLDHSYPEKRRILREYATKDLIREVVTKVADEAIMFDEEEDFIEAVDLPPHIQEEVREKYNEVFRNLFKAFGFNNGTTAWDYFKTFIIDGYLAFEIVYDDKMRNIIDLKQLDPSTLVPSVDPYSGEQIWIQFPDNPQYRRFLLDAQIVYISYSTANDIETSYVEGLIRPYNQLKLIQDTRIMFNIIHASMHKQFTIPVGGLSRNKAEQEISKMIADYKDEISFDDTMGTINFNGSPHIPYSKEYWFPSGEGETPSFKLESPQGIDLNEDSTITWFYKMFKRASKLPLSRFDEQQSGGVFGASNDNVSREELSFFNFINRLRENFKEIVMKPFRIQMLLEYPELKDDDEFLSSIALRYNGVNMFHEWRRLANLNQRSQILSTLSSSVVDSEGNAYFPVEYLVRNVLKLNSEDIKEVEKYRKLEILRKKKEAENGEGQEGGGASGAPGGAMDFGGGGDFGGGAGDFDMDFDLDDEGAGGAGGADAGGEDFDFGGGGDEPPAPEPDE